MLNKRLDMMRANSDVRSIRPKSDPGLQNRVKSILQGRWGERNAITSSEINQHCDGVDTDGSGNPQVRAAVRDFILLEAIPIASAGRKGYFLVETTQEHEDELRSLKHREDEIRRRRNALERAVQRERDRRDEHYPAAVPGPQGQLSEW